MAVVRFRDACRICWLTSLCWTCLGLVPVQAQVIVDRTSPVEVTECFQTVEADAVLVRDLVCEAYGLQRAAIEIGASDVTLDLDGHVLFAYPYADLGIRADGFDGVTIKNGTIDGFARGMTYALGHEMTLENVTIRNLDADDPEEFIFGAWMVDSQDVVVRDSFFEFLPIPHREGVTVAMGSEVTVDTIEQVGGGTGVGIGSDSRAAVLNSRFRGVTIAGVWIQRTDQTLIADNDFENSGIQADALVSGGITGLVIDGNSMKNGSSIHFLGVSDSSIRSNDIRDDCDWGIFLDKNMACPEDADEPECFYSTDNTVANNVVLGCFADLRHHERAVGNTWEYNTCLKKDGAEIPPCTRARRRLRSDGS